jgi:hypothetical protein
VSKFLFFDIDVDVGGAGMVGRVREQKEDNDVAKLGN